MAPHHQRLTFVDLCQPHEPQHPGKQHDHQRRNLYGMRNILSMDFCHKHMEATMSSTP